MNKKITVMLISSIIIIILISVSFYFINERKKESKEIDIDGDGYLDHIDAFPNNPNLWNNTIYSNSTWTLEYSPYIITSDFIIPEGLSLTIEPGVIVKLSGLINTQTEFNATDIIVYGTLIAVGTNENMITFTRLNNYSNERSDWGVIDIRHTSSNSILRYCIIEYAYNGLFIRSCVNVSNNIIRNIDNVGIEWSSSSDSGICDSNLVENCDVGIGGTYPWQLEISNNIVLNNEVGIYFDSGSSPIQVYHNEISGNDYGIDIENSNPKIEYNNISNNSVGIVFMRIHIGWQVSKPLISNNTIMNNSDSAISMRSGGSFTVNAKYNYWGTTNETLIANMMDANVDYDPWLLTRPW